MIATENTSAFLYSILTCQLKFPLLHPGYEIFKNFSTLLFVPTHPQLSGFEEFFNPSIYSNPSLLLGTRLHVYSS